MTLESKFNFAKDTKTVQNSLCFIPEVKHYKNCMVIGIVRPYDAIGCGLRVRIGCVEPNSKIRHTFMFYVFVPKCLHC